MTVKVTLTFTDFLNFQFSVIRKTIMPWLILFVISMCLMVSVPFLFAPGDYAYNPAFTDWFFAPAAFMIGTPLLILIITYFSAKQNFNNDTLIQKDQTYTFDETGFQVVNENSTAKINWHDMFKCNELKHAFIIYSSPVKAFIIPKRFIQEPELNDLRLLLRSNIRAKKLKWFMRPGLIKWACYIGIISILLYSGFPKEDVSKKYFTEGYEKYKQGDFQGAVLDFDKAIEADPSYAKAYCFRGCARFGVNDSKGACEDLYESQRLGYRAAKTLIEQYCN